MRIIVIIMLVVCFASCQKELSVENGRNNVVGLLRRAEAVTNGDTLITYYYYDNLSRLETVVTDGVSAGETYFEYLNFTRDFTSRITNIKQQLTQSGIAYDTTRTVIHYPDPVGLEYDYSITTSNLGYVRIDSAVYNFTGTRMMGNKVFTSIPDLSVINVLSERNEFVYDSTGNVKTRDFYSASNGSILFTATFNYIYGDEPDYSWYSVTPSQNYWLVGIPNQLNKNLKQLDVIDQTGLGEDISILTNLTLGPGDKPVTGEVIVRPYNQKTNYTFYYQ
ncbi:MAG: hypothetical protein IT249_02135 [Chitinophagaceae bacterium]|nr:hypothetical protein [Chitinophagaceae bacterium]